MKIKSMTAWQPGFKNAPGDWRMSLGQILVEVETTDGTVGVGVGGDWARWTSWPDGTLQRWDGSQSYVSSIETGLVAPKGISIAPGGDFWVVDAAADRVLHLSSTGALLSEFPTPGSDPLGISYWE